MRAKAKNLLRVLRGIQPDWIPVECPINSRYGDGAYQFVTYTGALPPHNGGFDLWGTHWTQTAGEEVPYIDSVPVSSLSEFQEFQFPDIDQPELWQDAREKIRTANGEKLSIARQVSSLWERFYFLYGFDKALMALVEQPDQVAEALDRIVAWQMRAADHFIALGIDAARISDDYGGQQNLLMSPKTWHTLIYPRLQKLVRHYQQAGVPVGLHSCGNLELIMDDLVELEIAAFNIQTNANPIMEYKARYGSRFRLWGGVSTQDVLATGTVEEIRQAILTALQQYGSDGMLVLELDQIVQVPDESLKLFRDFAYQYRGKIRTAR